MIYTGLSKLDEFISNGLHNCIIVDIFGASGAGKTQLLLQTSINAVKNNNSVLYIDTTAGFRPERILELQNKTNLNINVLDRITVLRITNTSEQIKSLEKIKNSNFGLIVIDNITELFSYEFSDENQIFKKNSLFMKYMHDLSFIAINKKIPIIITNTIRHIAGKEFENMGNATDLYTHVKIRLSKTSTKFFCESQWLENKINFHYVINPSGMSN